MSYIHRLLGKPDEPISAIELVGASIDVKLPNQGNNVEHESVSTDLSQKQDLVDRDYLKQCKKRISDLENELAEAQKNNDLAEQNRLNKERKEILDLLKTDTFKEAKTLLESGADCVVLRHPKVIETIRGTINKLMAH